MVSLYRFSTRTRGCGARTPSSSGSAAIFTTSLGSSMRFQQEAQAGPLHELADRRRRVYIRSAA